MRSIAAAIVTATFLVCDLVADHLNLHSAHNWSAWSTAAIVGFVLVILADE